MQPVGHLLPALVEASFVGFAMIDSCDVAAVELMIMKELLQVPVVVEVMLMLLMEM